MAKPRVADRYRYMTTTDICKRLDMSYEKLMRRLRDGVFPAPTMVNEYGVRYFDENWLRIAQAIEENSYEAQRRK